MIKIGYFIHVIIIMIVMFYTGRSYERDKQEKWRQLKRHKGLYYKKHER